MEALKSLPKLQDAIIQGSMVQIATIFKDVKGNEKVFLLNYKDPNSETKETVLHLAVKSGHPEILRYLLQNGANVNEKDVNKNTAMHIAVMLGNAELSCILSQFKANPKLKNAEGETPISMGLEELLQEWEERSERLKADMKRKVEETQFPYESYEDFNVDEEEEILEDEEYIFFSFHAKKRFKAQQMKPPPPPPVEEVKPAPVDHNKLRQTDDAKWLKFLKNTPAIIRFVDVPWPSGHNENILSIPDTMAHVEKKLIIKVAQLRWHPDKFTQKFGSLLHEHESAKINEKVKEVAQHINNLKSKLNEETNK